MARARISGVLLLALVALALSTAAFAATPRTSFNDIEDEVMCVSCGVPLNIAESAQADRERALIHRLIDRGLTKQQVKDDLVGEFGTRVLAKPKDSGFGLAAYLVPIAIALAGAVAIAVLVPRWRRSAATPDGPSAPTGPSLSGEDARRLEEDLARYDV